MCVLNIEYSVCISTTNTYIRMYIRTYTYKKVWNTKYELHTYCRYCTTNTLFCSIVICCALPLHPGAPANSSLIVKPSPTSLLRTSHYKILAINIHWQEYKYVSSNVVHLWNTLHNLKAGLIIMKISERPKNRYILTYVCSCHYYQ